MNHCYRKFLLLFLFCHSYALPAFANDKITSQTVLTIAYEVNENSPFHMGKDTVPLENPGITPEVLRLLENRLDIKFEFVRLPWQRGLEQLKQNLVDGIFHASYKDDRREFGAYPMKDGIPDPSKQLMTQSYVLYKRVGSPLSWNGNSFEHLDGAIGTLIGYAVVGDLRKMGVDVEEVASQRSNLKKLSLGRIDGVVGLETMNDLLIRNYPDQFGDLVKISPPVRSKPYYLMLSHRFVGQNPKLAEQIWDGIKDLRMSGEYQAISEKYDKLDLPRVMGNATAE